MAYNYLIDHALKHVWCAPGQDRQYRLEPARITGYGGVFNEIRVGKRDHYLPVQKTRFHVYMIGQLHPAFLGLLDKQYRWIKFSDAMNATKLLVDLYTDQGVQLPRFQAWYKVDADRNVLIAVQDPQPQINLDLNTEAFYIRFYTNAYYNSLRNASKGFLANNGMRVLNTDQILQLQNEYEHYQTLPGAVYAFVNGMQVDKIDLITVKLGDVVEYIYDASIYKIVTFRLGDLLTFTSTLDKKTKYLLHYAGANDGQIDYQDDIDIFLISNAGLAPGRYQGVFVHRNTDDAVRMVTHRDYAVTVQYLVTLATYRQWNDLDNLQLRLHIRYGGWDRGLVYEDSRIHELYMLTDQEILEAMIGTQSNVYCWQAAYLEASAYCAIMRQPDPILTVEMVRAAFGYNAISKLIADTPVFTHVSSNQTVANVPVGLQNNSWAYEYDKDGVLLGYHFHPGGPVYACAHDNAVLVEMISGTGNDELDETYGEQSVVLDPTADYRMYTCPIVAGVPTNEWTDVTGSTQYAIINGTLQWAVDPTKVYTLVRGNRRFLAYTETLTPSQGVLYFPLTHRMRRNGSIQYYVMQIPMGELDVWLNGHALIEGVDYFMQFPYICIVNKLYLTADPANTPQQIDIRFTGFCKADMSREDTRRDRGWVVDGVLSANNQFDIRDDKVLRIVVGGAVYDRSELKFAEDSSAVGGLDDMNGKPYLIRDIVVPMRGMTDQDTYTMRAHSLQIDQLVSDYMTLKKPQPPLPQPIAIKELYRVFSPFVSKLVYDLNSGVLDDPRLYQQYGTALVQELCKPYEYLLAFDPSQQALRPDPRFCIIDPHNQMNVINIGIYQYKFLRMAVKQYCGGQVALEQFVAIKDYQAA